MRHESRKHHLQLTEDTVEANLEIEQMLELTDSDSRKLLKGCSSRRSNCEHNE